MPGLPAAGRIHSFKYDYDCENRLTDVNDKSTGNPVSSYSYDYQGRRISKTVSGVTTKYCYDGTQVIAEYDGSNTLLRKFIYGPGIDKPICMIDVADSNTVYYYHFDGLGSVIALSDVNSVIVERYSYDVFGKPSNTSDVNNPYLFTGRRYDDETGLYYYRARYYDYATGRFLQTDPVGYASGLNLYSYLGNNPLNWVDPLGLCKDDPDKEPWWLGIVGGIGDAAGALYDALGGDLMSNLLWEGRHVGTQYGEEALDSYAYQIAFGDAKWYDYLGGFFSSLWTPKSWKTTDFVLATALIVAEPASKPNIPTSPPPNIPTSPQPPREYRNDTPPSKPHYDKKTKKYEPDHWHYQDYDWSPEHKKWMPGKTKYWGPDSP